MSEITEIGRCIDGACDDYDLCEVVFYSPEDGFNDRIICEGFKISGKLNAESKKTSGCYEILTVCVICFHFTLKVN